MMESLKEDQQGQKHFFYKYAIMKFLECIENNLFHTKKTVGKEGIVKYLEQKFDEYINVLKSISDKSLARELKLQEDYIRTFCQAILTSLYHYEKGHVDPAYTEFKKAMNIIKPFLFPANKGKAGYSKGLHKPLYRGRLGSNKLYSKGEMFHLPFSKREFANSQRFSIPGLPCLYLSNSIYVCWEELNRPHLNELQIARFQKENFNLNILDISLTPNQVKLFSKSMQQIETKEKFKSKYDYDHTALWFLTTWPLSLICSLSVTNENAPFKYEYIFPQFLLQWVTYENDVDGIKYFSVKSISFNNEEYSKFTNYVLPPKKVGFGNYCEHLRQSFKLSDPVSLELITMTDPAFTYINENWIKNVKYKVNSENIRLELIKGYPMPYAHTVFGKMETFIQNLDVDFLSEDEMLRLIQ
jgi:hypothetical protein